MASTLTYEQMMAEIVRQDNLKVDLLADTRKASAVVEDGRVLVSIDRTDGTQTFALADHAVGQIASDLEIPKRYFDRMKTTAPDLLAVNVNHWLAHEPKKRMLRGFKPEGGAPFGTGRAWVSSGYKRLDNIAIARHVFPVFKAVDGLTFHQSQITETKMYIRATLPGVNFDVKPGYTWTAPDGTAKVGDIICGGIEIKNSEVGAGAMEINPFVFRYACSNGLVVPVYGEQRRHVGKRITEESFYTAETLEADDRAFWLKVRDDAQAVLSHVRFDEIARKLGETIHGDKIVAPVAATEELAQRFSLSEAERDLVLHNLSTEGDFSQWGALNAVTAAAKKSESFDRQAELEEIGWDIGQLSAKEWANVAVAA